MKNNVYSCNKPGGEVSGSGATWPNRIRQINPLRDPMHNLIDAIKQEYVR